MHFYWGGGKESLQQWLRADFVTDNLGGALEEISKQNESSKRIAMQGKEEQ
jgi:hypothetical protein